MPELIFQKKQDTSAQRYLENFVLFTSGFKPMEDDSLQDKNAVRYCREVALQKAWRKRYKGGRVRQLGNQGQWQLP